MIEETFPNIAALSNAASKFIVPNQSISIIRKKWIYNKMLYFNVRALDIALKIN
jgi:hypothetical protein